MMVNCAPSLEDPASIFPVYSEHLAFPSCHLHIRKGCSDSAEEHRPLEACGAAVQSKELRPPIPGAYMALGPPCSPW